MAKSQGCTETPPRHQCTWDRVLKLRRMGPLMAPMWSRSLSVLPPGDGGTANSTRRESPRSELDLEPEHGMSACN